jgi:hypothetical protein
MTIRADPFEPNGPLSQSLLYILDVDQFFFSVIAPLTSIYYLIILFLT